MADKAAAFEVYAHCRLYFRLYLTNPTNRQEENPKRHLKTSRLALRITEKADGDRMATLEVLFDLFKLLAGSNSCASIGGHTGHDGL